MQHGDGAELGGISGKRPDKGSIVVFDDDQHYMGSMMAELLAGEGYQVTLITTGLCVSSWTEHSLEQEHPEKRLVGMGVEILPRHSVLSLGGGLVQLENLATSEKLAR